MEPDYRPKKTGEGPLAGVLVLDLAQARSGPTCVRQLVQLGADAIQVWAPGRADLSGSDFANMHMGKRSIVLDLRVAAGIEIFKKLVKRADVLVENFRPQVKERLGIAPDDLWKINPRLIYASLSGFGQDGPNVNRPGVDPIIQGYGGLMSVTGPPGTGPHRVGIAISDTASGTFLAQGVLAALYAREKTGKGQWVHTSLLESMINMLDFQATKWLIDKVVPGQSGNQHPSFFPMGMFRTKDGYMNIGAPDFQKLCGLIGLDALGADPRFQQSKDRLPHREELTAAIEGALMKKTTAEWIATIGETIPVGPVLAMDEVFADDQVRHLNITRTIDHPEKGQVDVLRYPVTFSDMPAEAKSGIEMPGNSTRAILAEVGFAETEIDALIKDGVAATTAGAKAW